MLQKNEVWLKSFYVKNGSTKLAALESLQTYVYISHRLSYVEIEDNNINKYDIKQVNI